MRINKLDQVEQLLKKPHIQRTIHSQLKTALDQKEVTILYGARQVGKSQEVLSLINELLVSDDILNIHYFNLDYPTQDFNNPDQFLNSLQHTLYNKTYVFIDEAQRLPNIGLFIKYLYDQNFPIKFFLTGSASLDIKEKVKEPLTGRKYEHILHPLNLSEILTFHGISVPHITGHFAQLEQLLTEYLQYGGYPEVVTTIDPSTKQAKITEITNSYLNRDLAELFNLENNLATQRIAIYLAQNIGSLLNIDGLSRFASVTRHQVEKTLDAFEKSFVLALLHPFYTKPTEELSHRPKTYFHDVGIRNALLNRFEAENLELEKGHLFENAIFNQLTQQHSLSNLKYWRTINQTEVDFILTQGLQPIQAIECKYTHQSSNLPRNLSSFITQYPQAQPTIITRTNYWQIWQ